MVLALILSISFSGLPAQLEGKANAALADVAKAKAALSAGNAKSSQSWLAKAESLLGPLVEQAPGGSVVKKMDQLDPSLAGKLGIAKQPAAQGDQSGASKTVTEAKGDPAQKTGLGELADVYQKVTTARSLLKAGENSKAKSLLDEIPLH